MFDSCLGRIVIALVAILALFLLSGTVSAADGEPICHSPVDGIPLLVTSRFGAARYYGPHEGLDLRAVDSEWRPVRILACHDGVVALTAPPPGLHGYGNLVKIDHGGGWSTWYAHLAEIYVEPGQIVRRGEVLGLAGCTGYCFGAHLHFGVTGPGGRSGYVLPNVWDPAPFLGIFEEPK